MPRTRTGALVPPAADGLWRARVTVENDDGSTSRPYYSLGTTDKPTARRNLASLLAHLASGGSAESMPPGLGLGTQSVQVFAERWLEQRAAEGVASVADERRNLTRHVLPLIGRLPLADVRSAQIRSVLEEAMTKTRERARQRSGQGGRTGYSQQTLQHVRGAMNRLFDAAWRAEMIEFNPVARVRTPRVREVRKERVILSDAEFERFIAQPGVDLELRMASVVARCEGGMRTGDLLVWDWSMIDQVHFAECVIPRSKTENPQCLAIPPTLGPVLRAWWERAGKPPAGAVFPARRGRRAGTFKSKRGNSFAKRLRTALFRAAVYRVPPIEVAATSPGTRTDLGRSAKGTKLAPHPGDPLYFETATTLPVDFHSFRRAFNTALAEADVTLQKAMALAAHSDARTHMRYVMRTTMMRTIPDDVLPRLPATLPGLAAVRPEQSSGAETIRSGPLKNPQQFQRATQESNLRPTAPEAVALSN
jgi:integrase